MVSDNAIEWVEVWLDSGTYGEFFLVLRKLQGQNLELVNPHSENVLIKRFTTYDEAQLFLSEDEYQLVEGRWSFH